MIQPMMALMTDTRNTAPAAISFTCLIKGCIDAYTTSERRSIAVFISSRLRTSAVQNKIINHSLLFKLNMNPPKKVIDAITNCIRKFFSE